MEDVMLPFAINAGVCAVVYENGIIIDECFNWETAETMASEGYEVVAVGHDLWDNGVRVVGKTKQEIQRICDVSLAQYKDCFGIEAD